VSKLSLSIPPSLLYSFLSALCSLLSALCSLYPPLFYNLCSLLSANPLYPQLEHLERDKAFFVNKEEKMRTALIGDMTLMQRRVGREHIMQLLYTIYMAVQQLPRVENELHI
jgi:hypothetical protein